MALTILKTNNHALIDHITRFSRALGVCMIVIATISCFALITVKQINISPSHIEISTLQVADSLDSETALVKSSHVRHNASTFNAQQQINALFTLAIILFLISVALYILYLEKLKLSPKWLLINSKTNRFQLAGWQLSNLLYTNTTTH